MAEMLLRKAAFSPSIAAPIRVTVTMPMTMPSVVSPERILLARIASQEMARPSRSSVRKFIAPGNVPPKSRRQSFVQTLLPAKCRQHPVIYGEPPFVFSRMHWDREPVDCAVASWTAPVLWRFWLARLHRQSARRLEDWRAPKPDGYPESCTPFSSPRERNRPQIHFGGFSDNFNVRSSNTRAVWFLRNSS